MQFFSIFTLVLISFPVVFTAPTAKNFLSSPITTSNLDRRRLPPPRPRPLPMPYGQQSCSNSNTMPLYWKQSPGKRSPTVVKNDPEPILSTTPQNLVPRQAGERSSPLCSMVSYFAFTALSTTGAMTNSVKVYPGVRYIFSIGCDIAVASVTTWYKNRDDSDPVSDWNVLIAKDYHHSMAGTMAFEVSEPTEVQFTVGFAFFGASGEVGLFQVNVQ